MLVLPVVVLDALINVASLAQWTTVKSIYPRRERIFIRRHLVIAFPKCANAGKAGADIVKNKANPLARMRRTSQSLCGMSQFFPGALIWLSDDF
jgi:hypothetical protein